MESNVKYNDEVDKSNVGLELATIDEALARTHFGKYNYMVILLSGVILINVLYESLGISYMLPVLDCDLDLTYQQQGVLSTVCFMGIIVSSPFWGFLADTTGRKRIMQPALLINFAITILSSFSINFIMLAVLRFINGIVLSAGSAIVFAYVGEFHCQLYRNRAILSAALISAVGGICFPLVAWISLNQNWQIPLDFINIIYKPWRFYLVACGMPGFLCGLMLFFLPESPKYLLSTGRADEALIVLKNIHKINTKNATSFSVKTLLPDLDTPCRLTISQQNKNVFKLIVASVWQQIAPLFMRPHLKHTFLVSLIQFLIYFTAHGVYMWLPHIVNRTMRYTRSSTDPSYLCDIWTLQKGEVESAKCTTNLDIGTYKHIIILEALYFGLLLITGYATGKFGRKLVIFLICFICSICGILSILITVPILAVYMFMIFLCCALGTTVVNSITVDIYPTNLRGMAVCISLMLGRIGGVVGSNVLGFFIDENCEASLYSAAIILILAGLLVMLLPTTNECQKKLNNNIN